ncbi:MAG: hypothetical protein IKM31_01875 [Oscillospiraceae bacterium]|nr:hypothetical protein [Oscillospiraceae bacterium]
MAQGVALFKRTIFTPLDSSKADILQRYEKFGEKSVANLREARYNKFRKAGNLWIRALKNRLTQRAYLQKEEIR